MRAICPMTCWQIPFPGMLKEDHRRVPAGWTLISIIDDHGESSSGGLSSFSPHEVLDAPGATPRSRLVEYNDVYTICTTRKNMQIAR